MTTIDRSSIRVDRVRKLLAMGGCQAYVDSEKGELTINVPLDSFGRVQAIVRQNKIPCIVRPY